MAKSIRSKCKRKNRTEFRNTIGTDAFKATQEIVQAKLQECVNAGGMNSFNRLSNLLDVNKKAASENADGDDDDDVVMNGTTTGKDASKIPKSKAKMHKYSPAMAGMYGDKTTRKLGEKKFRKDRSSIASNGGGSDKNRSRSRGRGPSNSTNEGRRLRGGSQKTGPKRKSGKKLATI
eukprot:CAMPEP_0201886712 /NCGR_PEP_ID=MMETSP0902-20130614/22893_1 /ASSEMBLY_ACC=CAM_ASM_000551 /TAXON_ID=420261 /ORGANISM="Thalassiosira antarctica, Strain CCMP982" /LENGTH=176 /DNA_ID=CAMNT_0048416381 /DNA_START=91 /DNA_END=621 /DNA_ORIENTATION=+